MLRHGDMIYLVPNQDNPFTKENHPPLIIESNIPNGNSSSQLNFISTLANMKEDNVDIQLDKMNGKIPRQMDPRLCEKNFVQYID